MEHSPKLTQQLERASRVCLFLLALSAPISIAATQIAWSFCLLFWLLRAIFVKPTFRKNAFDLAILAFVGLSLLSSMFSYEPEVSLKKMVAVSLVTIVYLVSENIKDKRTLYKLVAVLLISGAFTVAYTGAALIVGKNLKVLQLTADSPLRLAGILENDTILKANNQSINSPDELAAAVSALPNNGDAKIQIYRHEFLIDTSLPTTNLLNRNDSKEKFGIVEWSRGRDTRAAGTYGHYTTYAEVLQLVASLAFGLLIVSPGGLFTRNRILLAVAVAAFCSALFLTITRASWLSFLVSAAVIILIGASRKTVLICLLCAIPIVFAGTMYLQQKRNVDFIDLKDNSTQWRLTVWREGFDLLIGNPRHLLAGIGMDSIKTHWREWQMFDNGKQPIGHMHSTPLQIALERGVPTFLVWLLWMFLYLKILWQGLKRKTLDWREHGVLLGVFGGTIGFLMSGLVHYNWGDSEVMMVFYLLMGFSLAILRVIRQTNSQTQAENNA